MPVTLKDSPVTVETFADVLKLLQVDHLDLTPEIQKIAVDGTNDILARHGLKWFDVKANRSGAILQLEYLNDF